MRLSSVLSIVSAAGSLWSCFPSDQSAGCPTPPNCGVGTHQESCACVANSGNAYAGSWRHLYLVIPSNSAEDRGAFTVDANGAFAVPLGSVVLSGHLTTSGGMSGTIGSNGCTFSGSCPSSTTCSAPTNASSVQMGCAYSGGQGSIISRVNLTR